MVQLICSYFFDGEPVHLNDLYYRPSDSTHQYWTLPHVPGKRYVGKDVYILTSSRTFSGAEEFSYNMKNLKRATIVGETTGGGAHPGGSVKLNDHFSVFLPVGRAINPITKTNWEGTGVSPHISCPSDQALKVAQIEAMKKVIATVTDPDRKANIQSVLDTIQKELDAMKTAKS
jgi:C-terminal processing protease CtpA/Prc